MPDGGVAAATQPPTRTFMNVLVGDFVNSITNFHSLGFPEHTDNVIETLANQQTNR